MRVLPKYVAIVALFGAAFVALQTASASEAFMPIGGPTSQPIGHHEYCKTHLTECSMRLEVAEPLRLTKSVWRTILDVNTDVNESITPKSDLAVHGKEELWSFPTVEHGYRGDCEDYVLVKRHLLAESGISLANLLITVVRKPDGEGHAVLTVRTDRGDYILDNLLPEVRLWTRTPYRYLKRTDSRRPGRWRVIEIPQPLLSSAPATSGN